MAKPKFDPKGRSDAMKPGKGAKSGKPNPFVGKPGKPAKRGAPRGK